MEDERWQRTDITILYDTVYLKYNILYTNIQYLTTHSSGTKVEMTKSSETTTQYAEEQLRLAKNIAYVFCCKFNMS